MFYAYNGTLRVEYLDNRKGVLLKQRIGSYDNSFWPRDFLSSSCKMQAKNVTLSEEFGGRFNDGKVGVSSFACAILGNSNVTAFVDDGTLLVRLVVGQQLPLWEAQVWDIISLRIFDAPIPSRYMSPPP